MPDIFEHDFELELGCQVPYWSLALLNDYPDLRISAVVALILTVRIRAVKDAAILEACQYPYIVLLMISLIFILVVSHNQEFRSSCGPDANDDHVNLVLCSQLPERKDFQLWQGIFKRPSIA